MKCSVLAAWLLVASQGLLLGGCGGGDAGSESRLEIPTTMASVTQPESGTVSVKWNPGHYMGLPADVEDSEFHAGLDEIQDLPFVKGALLRVFWRQLEPQKDVYDFSRIDRYLELAAAHKKRFGLLLTTKNYRAGVASPDYLRTPLFDGGVFLVAKFKGTIGDNITLWDSNTYYRLVRLIKALATRYDGNPWFEVLVINETAFGQPVIPMPEAQRASFFDNLMRVDIAARQSFSRTVVIQYVNFPYTYTPSVAQNLLNNGIGIGGPDVFLDDRDHDRRVYPLIEPARARVPVGMQVEADCYYARSLGGPWDPPPVRELYDLARNRLHSNYIFWQRVLETKYRPWEKVLSMFRSPDFPADASGGLETACPASYARCMGQQP